MSRPSATTALSPKLLKHFAAATVVLTALIAVFASGADWGAQAQISAVEAKNQLVSTEAEKLGTKRIGKTLKIANGPAAASFGEEESSNFGGVANGYVAPARRAEPTPRHPIGSPWAMTTAPAIPAPPFPGIQPAPDDAQPTTTNTPSPNAIAQITASSAQRSGAAVAGD